MFVLLDVEVMNMDYSWCVYCGHTEHTKDNLLSSNIKNMLNIFEQNSETLKNSTYFIYWL